MAKTEAEIIELSAAVAQMTEEKKERSEIVNFLRQKECTKEEMSKILNLAITLIEGGDQKENNIQVLFRVIISLIVIGIGIGILWTTYVLSSSSLDNGFLWLGGITIGGGIGIGFLIGGVKLISNSKSK